VLLTKGEAPATTTPCAELRRMARLPSATSGAVVTGVAPDQVSWE